MLIWYFIVVREDLTELLDLSLVREGLTVLLDLSGDTYDFLSRFSLLLRLGCYLQGSVRGFEPFWGAHGHLQCTYFVFFLFFLFFFFLFFLLNWLLLLLASSSRSLLLLLQLAFHLQLVENLIGCLFLLRFSDLLNSFECIVQSLSNRFRHLIVKNSGFRITSRLHTFTREFCLWNTILTRMPRSFVLFAEVQWGFNSFRMGP